MRLSSRVGLVLALSLSVISASVAGSFKSTSDSRSPEPQVEVLMDEPGFRLALAAFLPVGTSLAGDTDDHFNALLNERERQALISRVRSRLAAESHS